MWLFSRVKWTNLAGYTLAAVVVALLIQIEMRAPTVNVVQDGNRMLVHVRQFGQISPKVSRIRLTDQLSNAVVLDLRKNVGTPQLYFFSLARGINNLSDINASADYSVYRVVAPAGSKWFELQKGRTYTLSIWGRYTWGRHSDTTLQIQ
jgi:hypothetical protein